MSSQPSDSPSELNLLVFLSSFYGSGSLIPIPPMLTEYVPLSASMLRIVSQKWHNCGKTAVSQMRTWYKGEKILIP